MSNANLVQTTLSVPLAIDGTIITLTAAVAPYNLPPADGGIIILADSLSRPAYAEIIIYTSRSGLNLTGLTRASEGTTARVWPVGTYCYQSLTAAQYLADMNARQLKETGKGLSANDFTAALLAKLNGIASSATANATDAALRDRTSHTGVQAISTVSGLQTALDAKVAIVSGKQLSTEDFSTVLLAKLNAIAASATANQTDAYLLARGNHTGTQAISTVVNLQTTLDTKVDKVAGYGLSETNFSAALNTKLAGLDPNHYRGTFTSLAALTSGVTSPVAGDYADVDASAGSDVQRYIRDANDSKWVAQSGTVSSLTAAQVLTLYESNADRFGFTTAYRDKLAGIAAGAQVNVATNIGGSVSATAVTLTSSTGTGVALNGATTAAAGLLVAADKTILDGLPASVAAKAATTYVDSAVSTLTSAIANASPDVEKAWKVGDIRISAVSPGSLYFEAKGLIKAQSSAPTLFAALGLLGVEPGATFSVVSAGTTTTVIDVASAPNPSGGAPLVMQATGTMMNFSADGGATWVTKTTPWGVQGNGTATSLAYDEYRSLWLATTNGTSSIAMSANNGDSWTFSSTSGAIGAAGRICADANGVWIATSSTTATLIVRSTDMGATWSDFTTGTTVVHTAISTDNNGVWMVCAGTQVRKSSDGGLTWAIALTASATQQAISNNRQGVWFTSGLTSASYNYRSFDNGLTWATVAGLSTATVTDIAYTQGFFYFVRSVSPQILKISEAVGITAFTSVASGVLTSLSRITARDGFVVAVTTANTNVLSAKPSYNYDTSSMFKLPNVPVVQGVKAWIKAGMFWASTGKAFTKVADTGLVFAPQDMATDDKGTIIGVGLNGIIRRSTDFGKTWATITSPAGNWSLASIATNGKGLWIIGGVLGYLLRSTDNGATFTLVQSNGFSGTVTQVVIGQDDVMVGCSGAAVSPRKSFDGGLTWASTGLNAAVSKACTDGLGNWLVTTGTLGTYRSTDNALNFSSTITSGLSVQVTDIKMSRAGVAYLCGASTSARKSTDYGVTWSALTLPTAGTKFAIGGGSNVMVYAPNANIANYSIDKGVTWLLITPSLVPYTIVGGINSPFVINDTSDAIYTATLDTLI